MYGCANWCHETSLTLSIDNWLNAVCHCQCRFPHSTLHFYHPDMHFCESCLSMIINYLTSSIHFSPILKENFYHLFAPILCWYVQRSGAILRNQPWSANVNTQKKMVSKQILNNICLLPFAFTFKKMQTQYWLCRSKHMYACLLALTKLLCLLAQHIDAEMSQNMPIAWHVWQK